MQPHQFAPFAISFAAALRSGAGVAVVCAPKGSPRFFCQPEGDLDCAARPVFFAVPWLGRFGKGISIAACISPGQAELLPDRGFIPDDPHGTSTPRAEYLSRVAELIAEIRGTGGKTVFSRRIVADFPSSFSVSQLIATAMSALDAAPASTFRTLFFSPRCGLWLSESPEVLVDYDRASSRLSTIALAGTRPSGATGPWDRKNILEQEMVTRFIADSLADCGWQFSHSEPGSRPAGPVEHIATTFTASPAPGRLTNVVETINRLSPTPALCGAPRPLSIERISRLESHSREMYGGYFGVSDSRRFTAAVTLRCARLGLNRCAVFAGGGITAQSVPADEWTESARKAGGVLASLGLSYSDHNCIIPDSARSIALSGFCS